MKDTSRPIEPNAPAGTLCLIVEAPEWAWWLTGEIGRIVTPDDEMPSVAVGPGRWCIPNYCLRTLPVS